MVLRKLREWSMKNVLVIGAAGQIGSELVPALRAEGYVAVAGFSRTPSKWRARGLQSKSTSSTGRGSSPSFVAIA